MIKDKVARICWNTNYWQKPSGMDGKVTNINSGTYEAKTGYGYEEWLLDTNKLIDGYHYGYIQAIGQHRNKYLGNVYNVSLYSINSKTKERWWLGEIKNVEVIQEKESKKAYKEYKKRHWLKEMYAQLNDVGANVEEFKSTLPEDFSCIKFKPNDLKILDEPRKFPSNDPAIKSDYYNLKNKIEDPILENQKFKFESGHQDGKTNATSSYKSLKKDIDLFHNRIQTAVYNDLVKKHGIDNVGTEHKTGLGTKIDVVVRDKSSYIFYEIKTTNNIKLCIREALSQLMEYAYYPNKSIATKLIIVSPNEMTNEAKLYLKQLRDKFSIPIYYQKFNIDKDQLNHEVS